MTASGPPLPAVTVVVPAFRHARRLRSCLGALAAQDHPPDRLEVVVVDDGSPEPLAPAAGEFAGRLRVTVHRQRNAGPAAARNTGAQRASGSLVAFTDDDCEPDPGWVRALAEAHRDAPDAMLGGTTANALATDRCAEASQMLVSFLYGWFDDAHPSRFFASNNLAVPREGFLALGGFDTTFPRPGGEDRELCERWRRSGRPLLEVPAATVRHAHGMGTGQFARQHWNYGRGAYDVSRRRAASGGAPLRPEPPRFYLELLRRPFASAPPTEAAILSGLLALSQAVNAAGFLWQWGTHAAPRLRHPARRRGIVRRS